MKLNQAFLAISLSLMIAAPAEAEKLTPKDTYQEDVLCAAASGQAASNSLLAPRYAPDKVEALSDLFIKRAKTTGAAIGLNSPRVANDVAAARRSMTNDLQGPNAAKAQAERDQTKIATDCAAIIGFETMQALKRK